MDGVAEGGRVALLMLLKGTFRVLLEDFTDLLVLDAHWGAMEALMGVSNLGVFRTEGALRPATALLFCLGPPTLPISFTRHIWVCS